MQIFERIRKIQLDAYEIWSSKSYFILCLFSYTCFLDRKLLLFVTIYDVLGTLYASRIDRGNLMFSTHISYLVFLQLYHHFSNLMSFFITFVNGRYPAPQIIRKVPLHHQVTYLWLKSCPNFSSKSRFNECKVHQVLELIGFDTQWSKWRNQNGTVPRWKMVYKRN